MKFARHAAVAIGFILSGTSIAGVEAGPQLRPLSTADVDPAAVDGSACYLHQGGQVLLIGARRNAVFSFDEGLLLVDRAGAGDGALMQGAGYRGSDLRVEIAVDPDPAREKRLASRIDRPATVSIRRHNAQRIFEARWNCKI
jgi:hypothetical protein